MNVRLYQSKENSVLARLFTETVHTINSADYSPEQVAVWADTFPDLDRADRIVLVAEHNSEIVGFAAFEPDGHLVYLYVHHRFQRWGVASALLRRVEEEAPSRSINRIFTEASITARPFFEHIGYQLIAPQSFVLKGTSFLFYHMEKFLA